MSNPRYTYLTKSYVEWAELSERRVFSATAYYLPENGTMPKIPEYFVVDLDDRVYLKSDDGLSYDLVPEGVWAL